MLLQNESVLQPNLQYTFVHVRGLSVFIVEYLELLLPQLLYFLNIEAAALSAFFLVKLISK